MQRLDGVLLMMVSGIAVSAFVESRRQIGAGVGGMVNVIDSSCVLGGGIGDVACSGDVVGGYRWS